MHKPLPQYSKVKAAALLLVVALGVTACSASGQSSSASSATGNTTITFWHEASGPGGTAINQLVQEFNSQNAGKITVNASYQGTYADAQKKYSAAVQSKSTPSILAMNDISTGFMLDSKQIVPMHTFTSGDSSFDINKIPTTVRNYYSDSSGLLSMPIGISQPVLYINVPLAKQAGLDLNNVPKTLDQIATWAKAIKAKTGQQGFTMSLTDSWMLEELSASGGEYFCTPANGRSSAVVTGVSLTTATQTAFINTLTSMFVSGVALNPGTDSNAITQAFTTNKVGLALNSSGSYTTMQPGGQTSNVLVVQFPKTSTSTNAGTPIGGNSLWISGPGHSTAEQKAAYAFAKFMQSPHAQAVYATATGYLFGNVDAKNQPQGQASLADPNVQTMYAQLAANPSSDQALGCRTGAFPAIRQAVTTDFTAALNGADPVASMQKAEQDAQKAIASYNQAAGK